MFNEHEALFMLLIAIGLDVCDVPFIPLIKYQIVYLTLHPQYSKKHTDTLCLPIALHLSHLKSCGLGNITESCGSLDENLLDTKAGFFFAHSGDLLISEMPENKIFP